MRLLRETAPGSKKAKAGAGEVEEHSNPTASDSVRARLLCDLPCDLPRFLILRPVLANGKAAESWWRLGPCFSSYNLREAMQLNGMAHQCKQQPAVRWALGVVEGAQQIVRASYAFVLNRQTPAGDFGDDLGYSGDTEQRSGDSFHIRFHDSSPRHCTAPKLLEARENARWQPPGSDGGTRAAPPSSPTTRPPAKANASRDEKTQFDVSEQQQQARYAAMENKLSTATATATEAGCRK